MISPGPICAAVFVFTGEVHFVVLVKVQEVHVLLQLNCHRAFIVESQLARVEDFVLIVFDECFKAMVGITSSEDLTCPLWTPVE